MKKPYTKRRIQEAIAYWERKLKKLDETVRTHLDRIGMTAVIGIESGYGLPDKYEMARKPNDFVGWAEAAEMLEWIKKGYVIIDADYDSFGENDAIDIENMVQSYGTNAKKDVRGAALAVADAPEQPDGCNWVDGSADRYLKTVNDRIDEIQRDNPAFKRASEIFLVSDKDGALSKLVAIWCTDLQLLPRLPAFMVGVLTKLKRVERQLGPNATEADIAKKMAMPCGQVKKLRRLLAKSKPPFGQALPGGLAENKKEELDMGKKPYTKRQIQEAIAYWESQLKVGNYRKVNESLEYNSFDDVFAELVYNVICQDRIYNGKLARLYGKENHDWNGDYQDDKFVDWKVDLMCPMFDGAMEKMLKSVQEHVLDEVKSEIDRRLNIGNYMKGNGSHYTDGRPSLTDQTNQTNYPPS